MEQTEYPGEIEEEGQVGGEELHTLKSMELWKDMNSSQDITIQSLAIMVWSAH